MNLNLRLVLLVQVFLCCTMSTSCRRPATERSAWQINSRSPSSQWSSSRSPSPRPAVWPSLPHNSSAWPSSGLGGRGSRQTYTWSTRTWWPRWCATRSRCGRSQRSSWTAPRQRSSPCRARGRTPTQPFNLTKLQSQYNHIVVIEYLLRGPESDFLLEGVNSSLCLSKIPCGVLVKLLIKQVKYLFKFVSICITSPQCW